MLALVISLLGGSNLPEETELKDFSKLLVRGEPCYLNIFFPKDSLALEVFLSGGSA